VEIILKGERKKSWAVTIVFASSSLIRKLNKQYLDRNGLTDVLAFDMTGGQMAAETAEKNLGDVYICVEVARKQAAKLGHSFTAEVLKLAAHGTLHLLGYDHRDEQEARKMTRKEESYISKLEARSK
jgi:probable rRNA maturation factor